MRRSMARLASACALAIATATFTGAAGAGGGHADGGWSEGGKSSGSYQKDDRSESSDRQPTAGWAETKTDRSSDDGDSSKSHDATTSWGSKKSEASKSYDVKKSDGSKSHDVSKQESERKSYDAKKSHESKSQDVSKKESERKSYDVKSYEKKSYDKKSEDHAKKSEWKSYSKSDDKDDDAHGVKSETKTFTKADHKVTICHLTGNGSYVAITVDKHSLKHGHTAAKGDIIPMPAGGCPATTPAPVLDQAATCSKKHGDDRGWKHWKKHGKDCGEKPAVVLQQQQPIVAKCGETTVTVSGGFLHKAGNGKYVLIHPSGHSAHSKGKHEDDIVLPDRQVVVKSGEDCTPDVQVVQAAQQTCAPVTTTKEVTYDVVDGVWHKTGKEGKYVLIHPSKSSAHWKGKHEDDIPNVVTVAKTVLVTTTPESCAAGSTGGTTNTTTTTTVAATTTQGTAAPAPAPTVQVESASVTQTAPGAQPTTQAAPVDIAQPQGGVAGVQATLETPQKRGGVLGTVGNVAGATLPFTGFPLWAAVLIAVALIAAGLMLRRGRGPASPRL